MRRVRPASWLRLVQAKKLPRAAGLHAAACGRGPAAAVQPQRAVRRAFPACSGSRRLVGSLSAARPRAKLRKMKALFMCPRPSWDKSVGSAAKDLKALKGAPRLVCQRRGAGCACPTRSSSHGRRFGSHLGGGGDGREPPAVRARASRASKAAGVAAARACGADPREVE